MSGSFYDRAGCCLDLLLQLGSREEIDVRGLADGSHDRHGEADERVHFRQAWRFGDEEAAGLHCAVHRGVRRGAVGDEMQHIESQHGVEGVLRPRYVVRRCDREIGIPAVLRGCFFPCDRNHLA